MRVTSCPVVPRPEGFPRTWDFQANGVNWLPNQKGRSASPAPSIPVSACDSQACHLLVPPPHTSSLLRFLPHHPMPSWLYLLSFSPCPSNCITAVLVPQYPHYLFPPSFCPFLSSASSASLLLLSVTEFLSLVSSSACPTLLPNLPSLPAIASPTLKKEFPVQAQFEHCVLPPHLGMDGVVLGTELWL